MPTRYIMTLIFCLPFCWMLSACKSNMFATGKSPQESYADRLKRMGLDSSAMGVLWFEAAARSLSSPLIIRLPFRETGFFSPDNPLAFGYRIDLKQGQQLTINVSGRTNPSGKIFIELWGPGRRNDGLELLDYADSTGKLEYEAGSDISVVLRLQNELLAPLSYDLEATTGPSLAFPVSGGGNKHIGSIWGDQRDAGARLHKGIDIFGKRGTPVLAAAEGRIISVRNGGLGGKTVWLRPSGKDITLYYAHLDSQLVEAGQRVSTGDTVGLLGNTGNAINTPPHLHFGIYGNAGAVNPIYYVKKETIKPAPITGNIARLGQPARTSTRQSLLTTTGAKTNSSVLDKSTYLVVTAVTGAYYKVQLPDRAEGLVPVSAITSLERNIQTISNPGPVPLLFEPLAGSAIVTNNPPSSLPVKGRFNGFAYVDNGTVRGWLLIQ